MASAAAAVSLAPSDAYEHSRTKAGLLARAGDDDAPGTPETESHPPGVHKVEAESPRVVAPTAEPEQEGPGTPRADHEPAPGEPAPFGLGGRDCAVGPLGWFAHAAEMVQVRAPARFPPVRCRVCEVPLTQPAPNRPQGHAKAADAGGKVAEQAEAARLSAEAHVADAKVGAEQFANESREKAEKAMNDAKEKTEQALNEAKQKTEQAMNEAKEKAEAMANEAKQKAEAFANEAKEKAEAFANEAKEKAEAFANEAKEKAAEIWCG